MLFTFERCYLDKRCVFLQDRSIAIHHFRLQTEQECVVSAYPPNYDCLKEINQYVIGTAPSFCITFQQKFISTKVKHCIHMSYPTVLQDSNQMALTTTVILMSLMYGITSMKEAQLMYMITFYKSQKFVLQKQWVQQGHHLLLPCVKVKNTSPCQCN